MTYSVEFIVNTGQFEHAKLTVSGETYMEFESALVDFAPFAMELVGRAAATLKGAVLYGYNNPDSKTEAEEPDKFDLASELIKSELGGKVLETRRKAAEEAPGPVVQVASPEPSETPSRPWNRPVQATQSKPWGEVKAKAAEIRKNVETDDFFG